MLVQQLQETQVMDDKEYVAALQKTQVKGNMDCVMVMLFAHKQQGRCIIFLCNQLWNRYSNHWTLMKEVPKSRC
jgi:hypothetical protein